MSILTRHKPTAEVDPANAFRENTLERMVYDALRESGSRGVSISGLFEVLYGSTTRMDPHSGRKNIHVIVHHVRRKLAPFGEQVITSPASGGYRLERGASC